jgi:hypothetical protein
MFRCSECTLTYKGVGPTCEQCAGPMAVEPAITSITYDPGVYPSQDNRSYRVIGVDPVDRLRVRIDTMESYGLECFALEGESCIEERPAVSIAGSIHETLQLLWNAQCEGVPKYLWDRIAAHLGIESPPDKVAVVDEFERVLR